jgi:hypothetical protein
VIKLGQSRAQFALDALCQHMRLNQRRTAGGVTVQRNVDAIGRVAVPQNDVMPGVCATHPIGNRHDLIAQPGDFGLVQQQRNIAGQRRRGVGDNVGHLGQCAARARFLLSDLKDIRTG